MKAPWFPFYTGDFLASPTVQDMEAHEVGAYVLLLARSWQSDSPGYLENDEYSLRRAARLSVEQWAQSKGAILKKWPIVEGSQEALRCNPRLVKEAEKQVELREKKAEAGRLSAERRAAQRQQNANTIPTPVEIPATGVGENGNYSQPQSQPHSSKEEVEERPTTTPLPAKKSKAEIGALLAAPDLLQAPSDSPLYKPHAFAAIITSLFPEANLEWYTKEMQAKAPAASMTAPSWRNWIINFMKNEAASKNGIVKVAPAAVKSKPFDKDDLFGFNTTAPYVAEPAQAYTAPAGQYSGPTIR